MNTIRRFQEDVYLRECRAKVTGLTEKDGKCQITLNQTIFFPTGGGQSCDVGTIDNLPIIDVYESDDEIFHVTDQLNHGLSIGDEVEIAIDWAHRFDNMQRHCGEHILSGIFFEL